MVFDSRKATAKVRMVWTNLGTKSEEPLDFWVEGWEEMVGRPRLLGTEMRSPEPSPASSVSPLAEEAECLSGQGSTGLPNVCLLS